ncbi:MAG: hypothetical protein E7624_05345 [Ruminococcaceae bacterium]|nr:hypothetical protein [Oscillospiraceae bacterium]
MTPQRRAFIHRTFVFLLLTVIAHAVADLFYIVMLAAPVQQSLAYPDHTPMIMVICFSLALFLIFTIFLAVTFARNGEERRKYQALLKEHPFTLSQNFKYLYKDALHRTVIYAIFQLPFVIFYSAFGFSYGPMTGFERFYILDVAFYEITQVSVLGFLLNGMLFFALSLLTKLFVLHLWKKEAL